MTGLAAFAARIGRTSAVAVAGGRTHWTLGGALDPSARVVTAPRGVVEHDAAEMTVRVGAGTLVSELLAALAERGQTVHLPGPPRSTVGGALMVGRSGIRRLGAGPVRDAVLQVTYVSAEGEIVRAGGPTVKNVSGYDLVRLLVGSLGTLGLVGEVLLRTVPRPRASRWFCGEVAPAALAGHVYRPASVLWNGATTWVLLEGHEDDVGAQGAVLGALGLSAVDGPPPLPPHRHVLDPAAIAQGCEGPFVAEVGVGIVHRAIPPAARAVDPRVLALGAAMKRAFDPTGRLNPGRDPYAVA